MGGALDAALHLSAGGHPDQKPDLDYTLFLPYLYHLFGETESLKPFDKKNELLKVRDFLEVDLSEVRLRGEMLFFRRVEASKSSAQLCAKYPSKDVVTRASLIYQLYFSIKQGYGTSIQFGGKYEVIKESINSMLQAPSFELELKYFIHGILFEELESTTLSHLVHFVLVTQPPIEVATSMVASCLNEFEQLLNLILAAYKANTKQRSYISEWISAILALFPHFSELIGYHLSSWKVTPGVIRSISFSDSLDLQLSFLNGLVNSHSHSILDKIPGDSSTYQAQSVITLANSPDWLKDRAVDCNLIGSYIHKLSVDFFSQLNTLSFSQLCGLLRVLTSFKLIYNFKFNPTHLSKILTTLNDFLGKLEAPTRFFDLSLCFVIISSLDPGVDGQEELATSLEALFNHHFEAILHLVTAIRCNNEEAVSTYFSLVLGFKFRFDSQYIAKLKGIFLSQVFEDETLASRICSVTSIDYSAIKTSTMQMCLATRQISYLLGCGIKMIRDKDFIPYKLDIQAWICSLITNLKTLPIHFYLPPLIREYVLCATQIGPIFKIPEPILSKHLHLSCDNQPGPKEVMFLYYALLYNERLAEFSVTNSDIIPQLRYSDGFYDQMSVKRIMCYIEDHDLGPELDGFKAEFSGLVRSTFSHFFGVTSTLSVSKNDLQNSKYPTLFDLNSIPCFQSSCSLLDTINIAFTTALDRPKALLLLFNYIKAQPVKTLIKCTPVFIKQGLPALLRNNLGQDLLDAYFDIWNLINNIIPETLWPLTVNSAQPPEAENLRECTLKDLFEDPLILARIHPRFFHVPQLFQIFITLLNSVSDASRSRFQRIQRYRHPRQKAIFSVDDIRQTLFIQDTTTIHMVLEICQDSFQCSNMDGNISDIRRMAFNFIHLQFVEFPHYIKIVHFHTYPSDLIPLAVENIPSIHVVMDFLPELVADPSPSKRWFGLLLASHVFEKYPLATSLGLAKDHILPALKIIVSRMSLIVSAPDAGQWTSMFGNHFSKTTLRQEIIDLKQTRSLVTYRELDLIILRLASTFTDLAKIFLEWFKAGDIRWDTTTLKPALLKIKNSFVVQK